MGANDNLCHSVILRQILTSIFFACAGKRSYKPTTPVKNTRIYLLRRGVAIKLLSASSKRCKSTAGRVANKEGQAERASAASDAGPKESRFTLTAKTKTKSLLFANEDNKSRDADQESGRQWRPVRARAFLGARQNRERS